MAGWCNGGSLLGNRGESYATVCLFCAAHVISQSLPPHYLVRRYHRAPGCVVASIDGGGYQYRLCKADDPLGLTEACFFKNPLPFTNSQRLRWGGKHGRVQNITGRLASDGVPKVGHYQGVIHTDIKVLPAGSAWARNPIPRIHTDNIGMAFVGQCLPQHSSNGEPTCRQVHKLLCIRNRH